MDLAVHNHRIDRAPDIVDGGVADDIDDSASRDRPRPRRHESHRETRRGSRSRRRCRVTAHAARPADRCAAPPRARPRRCRCERSVPLTAKLAVGEFEIGRRRLEHMGGDLLALWSMMSREAFSMTMLASRSARPECEPPPTDTRSVSPVTRRIASIGTPSHSLISCAKLVSCPWPLRHRADHDLDDPIRQIPSPRRARAARRSRCRHNWRRRCRGIGRALWLPRAAPRNPSQSPSASDPLHDPR